MKIQSVSINFCSNTKTYKMGDHTVVDYFDDDGVLIKRCENDQFKRIVDSKTFDKAGNIQEHLHKDYYRNETEQGFIETFKNQFQEYTRKSYTKIENGLKHSIDDFKSKTGKNYINEFIHDNLTGKLIKVISNGIAVEIK